MIRELEKKAKEVTKMNLKNVKMVDEQITKEAIQRTREMLVLYKIMKEASVDYLLFKDFHNTR
jgi:pyruvate/2-oxoglutarate/acetoin dehydrogenase E1 component